MIKFENIDTGETVGYSRKNNRKFYGSMLAAAINSSNMGINADRGQDFGWRLIPEQQALIEQWEADPVMVDRISVWAKVMIDSLSHADFLQYLSYQQELGISAERSEETLRQDNQRTYEARVAALKQAKAEAVPAFDPAKIEAKPVAKTDKKVG